MKVNRLITLATLAALGVASADLTAQERERRRDRREEAPVQQPSPSTRPAAAGYSERYGVLEQRNVFLKDRSRPATRSSGSSASTQPTRRSPEESLVVRGIAMEEIGYRAYVEDLNANSTLRLSPGDSLGRGRVAAIALDAIAYEHDGKQTWIEIGNDLTGKFSAASTPAYASSSSASATTGPTSLPANVDLNDPSLSAEQRMRLRRQLLERGGR